MCPHVPFSPYIALFPLPLYRYVFSCSVVSSESKRSLQLCVSINHDECRSLGSSGAISTTTGSVTGGSGAITGGGSINECGPISTGTGGDDALAWRRVVDGVMGRPEAIPVQKPVPAVQAPVPMPFPVTIPVVEGVAGVGMEKGAEMGVGVEKGVGIRVGMVRGSGSLGEESCNNDNNSATSTATATTTNTTNNAPSMNIDMKQDQSSSPPSSPMCDDDDVMSLSLSTIAASIVRLTGTKNKKNKYCYA